MVGVAGGCVTDNPKMIEQHPTEALPLEAAGAPTEDAVSPGESHTDPTQDADALQRIHSRYASKVWRTWALLAPLLLVVPALVARWAAGNWDFGILVTLIWWLAWLPITAALGSRLLIRPLLRRLARHFAQELEAKGWSAAQTVPTLPPGPELDALTQLLPSEAGPSPSRPSTPVTPP